MAKLENWTIGLELAEEIKADIIKHIDEEMASVKAELDYLRYFHAVADFGPADSDVRDMIKNDYCLETGNSIPTGY